MHKRKDCWEKVLAFLTLMLDGFASKESPPYVTHSWSGHGGRGKIFLSGKEQRSSSILLPKLSWIVVEYI
jgi:hypothetical protein